MVWKCSPRTGKRPRAVVWGSSLAGEAVEQQQVRHAHRLDDTVLLVLNAQPQAVSFVLPALQTPGCWEVLLCTDGPLLPPPAAISKSLEFSMPAQSLALLRYARGPEPSFAVQSSEVQPTLRMGDASA